MQSIRPVKRGIIAIQDKGVELGLLRAEPFDPKAHGDSAEAEPGDDWFVPTFALSKRETGA